MSELAEAPVTDHAETAPESVVEANPAEVIEEVAAPETEAVPTALESAKAGEWSIDKVPEKYIVKNAEGEVDVLATARKVDEHRASLERRMGEGNLRPKSPDEYKIPEDFGLEIDPEKQKTFFAEAHKRGYSQDMMDFALNSFKEELAELGIGAEPSPEVQAELSRAKADETIATLKDEWGDSAQSNFIRADRAANALAEKAGVPYADIAREIGNSPIAIKLLAAIGGEMGEDKTPSATPGGGINIDELLSSPAYLDINHPDHAEVSKKVRTYFNKGGK